MTRFLSNGNDARPYIILLISFMQDDRRAWAINVASTTMHAYIKMLKRQMYGRANGDLLRRRVLLAS